MTKIKQKKGGSDKVPVTVKFQVTASWSLLTLEVYGLPGGLENPTPPLATHCMQMSRRTVLILKESCDQQSLLVILLLMNYQGTTTNSKKQ